MELTQNKILIIVYNMQFDSVEEIQSFTSFTLSLKDYF